MNEDSALARIRENGWRVSDEIWQAKSAYEKDFAAKELGGRKTPDYYRSRLQQIGFSGLERVLDAACGIGQWSCALATLNREVVGIDLNTDRINAARQLAQDMPVSKCFFSVGPIEMLDHPDNSFDAVFCYGAFMFTAMSKTLAEFVRVTRPGGSIYLNGNAVGWYAHLLIDRGLASGQYRLVLEVGRAVARTIRRCDRYRIISASELQRLAERNGLHVLATGAEGSISLCSTTPVPPAYRASYYSLPAIVELLAKKS